MGCVVGEWELMKGLYLLVKIDVLMSGLRRARSDAPHLGDGRKRGVFGHYKKRIFRSAKNYGFSADFEKRCAIPILINEYGYSMNCAFLLFGQKRVKNTLKKNIVSNLR